MGVIYHNDFNDCVAKYNGDYKVKEFSCWKQKHGNVSLAI